MSRTGPAPSGARVSTGRLRVDAARAVDKLREYQLPDPTMWVLEVVRAATLARAERIRVYGDADDVVVSWDGAPLDADDLARLFDELVDPAPSPDRRPLRLLATGVNSALGLDPRWVDLVSCDGSGSARAVRYTPRLLQRGEDGTARGLRELAAEERVPGPLAPTRGVMVHVRRLPLLGALPILIGIGEPAELSVVRRACSDVQVPLALGRAVLGRERSHADLVRMALGEGLDGFLAVVDPSVAGTEAHIDVAELGVLLARYTLPLDGLTSPRAKVPLRLLVDAERMPTNASRSAVRLDEPPVRDAIEQAQHGLGALAERLAKELSGDGEHEWSAHRQERLRAAALSWIAAAVAGREWRAALRDVERAGAYGATVARLASLPLVRDALGRPRAPASFALRSGSEHVHVAIDPVAEELEPWLGEVLWVPPGDPASVLLGEWRAPSTRSLLARVKGHQSARERWLRSKPRPAVVADAPGQLLAVPIRAPGPSLKSCAPRAAFHRAKGIEGELVLNDPRSTRASVVVLRIGGREIERLSIDLPIPIEAAVEHAGLCPSPDYRRAELDEVFEAVLDAVRASAIVACEALALRMEGRTKPGDRAIVRAPWIAEGRADDRPALASVVRGALELALAMHERGGEGDRVRAAARMGSKSPIFEARAWPLLGGGWRSLQEIAAEAARKQRVIAFARTGARDAAREGGRAVQLLSRREEGALAAIVAPAALVDYGPALVAPGGPREPDELARAISTPGSAVLSIRGDGYAAAVGWTSHGSLVEVRHWGRTLSREHAVPDSRALTIVVDDERVVPAADWSSMHSAAPEPYPFAEWHRALATAFADALIGRVPLELRIAASEPSAAKEARAGFFGAIAIHEASPEEWLGRERVAALRRAPFVTVLGEERPISLEEIAARFAGGAIPWLPSHATIPFDAGDWHPILVDASEVGGYMRLLGRDLELATDEIERRKRAAARAHALSRHRLAPIEDPARDWAPSVTLAGTGFRSGVVALAESAGAGAQVIVSIEGRRWKTIERTTDLPVRLAIDFEEIAADEDLRELSSAAGRTIEQAVVRGARALLRKLTTDAPGALVASPRAFELLCAWAARIEDHDVDRKLVERVISAPAFPTVQGGVASLEQAATANGMLRVALFEEPWLAPLSDERESAYDRAVVRLLSDEAARSATMTLLAKVWTRGTVRDVSAAVARLQTERRIARGLVAAPRLGHVKDPRFRYPLDQLLADDAESAEALGVGEAALDDGEVSRIQLFEGGVATRAIELNLIPRVIIAAASPLTRQGVLIERSVRERLHDALRAVTSQIIRRVVDDTPPDQLPEWVRRELRTSCLHGGATHFERLAATPMFETTTGAWVTPSDLRAQRERFGSVWWTSDVTRAVPLDEARIALRLTSAHAALLAGWIELTEATEELARDQRARQNRERPPVESLEPTDEEKACAAAMVRLDAGEGDPSHGFVVVLKPGYGLMRGMHVHREMRSLGRVDDPSHWPAVTRVEHPELTPNRTWDGPESDAELTALCERVRRAVDRELTRLLPFPARRRFALRLRAVAQSALELPAGAVAEGIAMLEDANDAGVFRVSDSLGERDITPTHEGRALPISGTIWMEGGQLHSGSAHVFAAVYRRLLERVAVEATRQPADAGLALHLARGLALLTSDAVPPVVLSCFTPEAWTLDELLTHVERGGFVLVTPPERASDAIRSNAGERILVNDGSPLARELVRSLGPRAIEWPGAALRAHVGVAVSMPAGAADPKPLEPPPIEEPSALEAAVTTALGQASLPGLTHAKQKRSRSLVRIQREVLMIATDAPALRGLEDDARLAPLLVARAAGVLHRSEGRLDAKGELEAMERLLDAIAAEAAL